MANEKDNNGIFWALLLLIGGGAIWAINKFMPSKSVSTNVANTNTPTNTTTTPPKTIIKNPTATTTTVNTATKNGYPFSIDTSKILESNIGGQVSFTYTDIINSKSVTYDAFELSGVWYLYKPQTTLNGLWYGYGSDGLFIGTSVDPRKIATSQSGGLCFIGDTIIRMSDGYIKYIQDIKIGDLVIGKDSHSNKVLEIHTLTVNEPIFGFNDIEPFVTGSHPFFTKKGWKSVEENNTHKDLKVGILENNDEILKFDRSYLMIKNISEEYRGEIIVYSLTLDGDNTYFANDLCVHNKKIVVPKGAVGNLGTINNIK